MYVIVKNSGIAALEQLTDIDLLNLLLHLNPSPPIASLPLPLPYGTYTKKNNVSTSTVTLLPYVHIYCGSVALLPGLL